MKKFVIVLTLIIFSCSKSDDSDSSSFLKKYNNTFWLLTDSDSYGTIESYIKFSTSNVLSFYEGYVGDDSDAYCWILNEGTSTVNYDGETFTQTTEILENKGKRYSFSQTDDEGYVSLFEFVVSEDEESVIITLICDGVSDGSQTYARSSSVPLSNCISNQYLGC